MKYQNPERVLREKQLAVAWPPVVVNLSWYDALNERASAHMLSFK